MSVRGISRYLRICGVYLGVQLMASTVRIPNVCPQWEGVCNQLFGTSDKAMFRACDFKIPSINFPYQVSYNKCYTILTILKDAQRLRSNSHLLVILLAFSCPMNSRLNYGSTKATSCMLLRRKMASNSHPKIPNLICRWRLRKTSCEKIETSYENWLNDGTDLYQFARHKNIS